MSLKFGLMSVKKFGVEFYKCVKHIHFHMDKLFYALSLEIFHACRSTGNHKQGTSVEFLECLGAYWAYSSSLEQSTTTSAPFSIAASTPSLTVLKPMLSMISYPAHPKKLAENCALAKTHGKIADCEHKHLRTFAATLCVKTQLLELACRTVEIKTLYSAVLCVLFRAATATAA